MSRVGFVSDDDRIFLQRCPKCGRENWAMTVSAGTCWWCGYRAKKEDVE